MSETAGQGFTATVYATDAFFNAVSSNPAISINSDDPVSPTIFVYDNYPGGIGFSAPLFRMHHELMTAARRLIDECECENGCPGCVGPVGNTGPLAKSAALRIVDRLLVGADGA